MQQVCLLINKDGGKDGIFKSVLSYDYSTWGDQILWDLDFLHQFFRIFWTVYWDEADRIYCEYFYKAYLKPFNFCDPMRNDIVIIKDLFWCGRQKIVGFTKNYCNMISQYNGKICLTIVQPFLRTPICDL